MNKELNYPKGATHKATLPDCTTLFYNIQGATILLWKPYNETWGYPIGDLPYNLERIEETLEQIERREWAKVALDKFNSCPTVDGVESMKAVYDWLINTDQLARYNND